jgi:hypothetical protein
MRNISLTQLLFKKTDSISVKNGSLEVNHLFRIRSGSQCTFTNAFTRKLVNYTQLSGSGACPEEEPALGPAPPRPQDLPILSGPGP